MPDCDVPALSRRRFVAASVGLAVAAAIDAHAAPLLATRRRLEESNAWIEVDRAVLDANIRLIRSMLAGGGMRVALVTTHLPLRDVSAAITAERLDSVLRTVDADLRRRFGLARPKIQVCGLNPHAGEGGHLGREEIDVIVPVMRRLEQEGLRLAGPVPADTAFLPARVSGCDVVVAMYHDQGLAALKAASFGHAVNVTLGLPIIRTSVDHGTAVELAGSDRGEAGSLAAAISLANDLCDPTRT